MFLVESTRKESNGREMSQLSPIVDAITPVMTVFAKDIKVDVELTCLKLVDTKANQTLDVTPQKGSGLSIGSPSIVLSALLALTYAVFL